MARKTTKITPNSLYDCDLEVSILSSILFQPEENFSIVSGILKADDFFEERHGEIFNAMALCQQFNEPIDATFVRKRLGARFNDEVFNKILETSSLIPVEKYALELKERATKRAILYATQKIPEIVTSTKSSQEIVDEVSQEIYSLVDSKSSGEVKNAQTIIEQAFAEMTQIANEKKDPMNATSRVYTGYGEMDESLGGFKGGDLIIVAARPGMGKTAFALNIASRVLARDIGVVFFSLEMPATQLMYRLMSLESKDIKLTNLFNVELDDYAASELSQVADRISKKPFWVYDSANVGVLQVRTILRRLKMQHPQIRLCVIDYIGLMTNTANYNERHLQIGEISRGLKLLARELDMPIIALSQLNRNLESRANKRPMLSDLRESGSIEQDADTIMFVYRDDVYKESEAKERYAAKRAKAAEQGVEFNEQMPTFTRNPNGEEAEIIVGKNRNGPLGTIKLIYESGFTRFKDIATEPVMQSEFKE